MFKLSSDSKTVFLLPPTAKQPAAKQAGAASAAAPAAASAPAVTPEEAARRGLASGLAGEGWVPARLTRGWFAFNDSKVQPVGVGELERQFQGTECAYMLLYRSAALQTDWEEAAAAGSRADAGAVGDEAGVAAAIAGAAVAGAEGRVGEVTARLAGLQLDDRARADATSPSHALQCAPGQNPLLPPPYWLSAVRAANAEMQGQRRAADRAAHCVTLHVHTCVTPPFARGLAVPHALSAARGLLLPLPMPRQPLHVPHQVRIPARAAARGAVRPRA